MNKNLLALLIAVAGGLVVLYFDKTTQPVYEEPTPVVVESSQKIEINDSNCAGAAAQDSTVIVTCD